MLQHLQRLSLDTAAVDALQDLSQHHLKLGVLGCNGGLLLALQAGLAGRRCGQAGLVIMTGERRWRVARCALRPPAQQPAASRPPAGLP